MEAQDYLLAAQRLVTDVTSLLEGSYDYKLVETYTLFSRSKMYVLEATRYIGGAKIAIDARVVATPGGKVIAYAASTVSSACGSQLPEPAKEVLAQYNGGEYQLSARAESGRVVFSAETPALPPDRFGASFRNLLSISEALAVSLASAPGCGQSAR